MERTLIYFQAVLHLTILKAQIKFEKLQNFDSNLNLSFPKLS